MPNHDVLAVDAYARSGARRCPSSPTKRPLPVKDMISKPAVVSGEVLLLTPYEDEREMYHESLTSAGFHVTCDHPDRGHVLARRLIPNVIVKRTRAAM